MLLLVALLRQLHGVLTLFYRYSELLVVYTLACRFVYKCLHWISCVPLRPQHVDLVHFHLQC